MKHVGKVEENTNGRQNTHWFVKVGPLDLTISRKPVWGLGIQRAVTWEYDPNRSYDSFSLSGRWFTLRIRISAYREGHAEIK